MKKFLLLALSLFCYISLANITHSYEAVQIDKSSIDQITCDLNFTGEMRQGYAYTFSDLFSNPSNEDVYIKEVDVHLYEQSDINESNEIMNFSYTPWITEKEHILNAGDEGILLAGDDSYSIIQTPESREAENFKITYTAEYYYKDSHGDFTKGPIYHTECKDYEVTWCGDGVRDSEDYDEDGNPDEVCDPNDASMVGWGTGGCSETCQPITKTVAAPKPSCEKISVETPSLTSPLSRNITCSGNDMSNVTIHCGDGTSFDRYGDNGNVSVEATCMYTQSGNYAPYCEMDGTSQTCKTNVEIVKPYCSDGKVNILDLNNDGKSDEVCDPNDTSKAHWGTGGCSQTCQPVTEEIPEPDPTCEKMVIQKTSGIESLTTKVACLGTNMKKVTIHCGNGVNIEADGKGLNDPVIGECSYTKPGAYEAYCEMEGSTKVCSEEVNIVAEPVSIWGSKIQENYLHYKKIEDDLDNKIQEETQNGIGLITPPRILPKTGTPILDRVKKVTNSKLSLDLIPERYVLAGSKKTNISHWKSVLPPEDQNADKYIVIPSNGMVTPINGVPLDAPDYNTLISGREIQVNKYLKTGAMEYAGTSINGYGEVGNKVVFAHSSYFKSDDGRYKTDFQKIIELDEGEEIWVYERKSGQSNYSLYKYTTVKSYNTDASDVGVLQPGIGKNLTLFTCTPIGGIEGRWIIQAKYIDEEKSDLEAVLNFSHIDPDYKNAIQNFVAKFDPLTKEKRQKALLSTYGKVSMYEEKVTSDSVKSILTYLKYQLAVSYHK